MKRLLFIFICILCFVVVSNAQDVVGGLEPIGAITSFNRTDAAVTFNCQGNSQVRIYILAPDLVRVRASFTKPLPARDHSWAIAATAWDTPRWNIQEQPDSFIITTDELEVVVRRSPLLIEFRDARTHRTINADERPMMYDARGVKRDLMFDPSAGTTVAATKKLGYEEHFYGLGEKAAHLDRRRSFYRNWNSDTPAYSEGTDPIYQTIPFYLGLQRGEAYGIFFDNSFRSYFDFGRSSQLYAAFAAEGGEMNYYFFWGPSIKKILGRYADLTGHMPMPPLWALGNQQSRWSYYPDTLVEEVVRRYHEEDLPLDVLHLDIDYMQDYRVFTWNRERFPDPDGLINRLGQQGIKVVTIVDPGVKYQQQNSGTRAAASGAHPELEDQSRSYYVFNEGLRQNFFQKRKNGQLFIPKVWPGESVFVDFTREDARRWWGDLHRAYTEHGVA
ncbi:MAG TPA: TIM-barrel domain-containing protein, partial [Pyrinomonadaceae bacterium]|nr:TIM-barrel domain-containing protein [Pyrinomonadaceae bacterium]